MGVALKAKGPKSIVQDLDLLVIIIITINNWTHVKIHTILILVF